MKSIRTCFAACVASVTLLHAEPAEKAAPVFPSEIRLASGATLRKCSPVRWTSDSVVVKHLGGADPIRFAHMAEADRTAVLAFQSYQTANSSTQKGAKKRALSGQVFVATVGAGSYKFGGVTVAAFSEDAYAQAQADKKAREPLNYRSLQPWERGRVDAELWAAAFRKQRAVSETTTDADGNYTLQLPKLGEFVVFCYAFRRIGHGLPEHNVWIVRVEEEERLELANGNRYH